MSTYAIFLNAPSQDAWGALKAEWPDRSFVLDDRLAFVAPEGITTTSNIADTVGIRADGAGLLGVVVEMSSYSGFNQPALWEWLTKVRT